MPQIVPITEDVDASLLGLAKVMASQMENGTRPFTRAISIVAGDVVFQKIGAKVRAIVTGRVSEYVGVGVPNPSTLPNSGAFYTLVVTSDGRPPGGSFDVPRYTRIISGNRAIGWRVFLHHPDFDFVTGLGTVDTLGGGVDSTDGSYVTAYNSAVTLADSLNFSILASLKEASLEQIKSGVLPDGWKDIIIAAGPKRTGTIVPDAEIVQIIPFSLVKDGVSIGFYWWGNPTPIYGAVEAEIYGFAKLQYDHVTSELVFRGWVDSPARRFAIPSLPTYNLVVGYSGFSDPKNLSGARKHALERASGSGDRFIAALLTALKS